MQSTVFSTDWQLFYAGKEERRFPLLSSFDFLLEYEYIYIYIQVEQRSHLSEHYIDGVSLFEAFIVVTITNVGEF